LTILKEIYSEATKLRPIQKCFDRIRYYDDFRKITDYSRIYWIPPERIAYVTCPSKVENEKKTHVIKENFDERMRGRVADGDWDKASYRFVDFSIYKTIKQTIESNQELQNSTFFKPISKKAKSPSAFWSTTNADNLRQLFEYFKPKLNLNSKKEHLNSGFHLKNGYSDVIDVNIGRNGQYLFQNNVYALSIAKVFKVGLVPVMVFVRHKQWETFRESLLNFAHQDVYLNGFLFQPIVHPDFVDFPTMQNKCQETMDSIRFHLTKKSGTMLDIGANLGFFCHKFEDLGYRCYAVESETNTFRILDRIRDAENKKFIGVNKSIFEADFVENTYFDVVLALNIFHHFLKEKTLFYQFKEFLQKLKTDTMFFSAADSQDEQMRHAYRNFSESEFVEFILRQTSLTKSEMITLGRLNRPVYKLSR